MAVKPSVVRAPASLISKTFDSASSRMPWLAAGGIQGTGGDLVAHRHQLAQDRPLAHDLGIALDVGRRRRVVGDLPEVGHAAGLLGLRGLFQGLEHRHHVGRATGLDQARDVAEDAAVVVTVEIRLGNLVGDAIPGAVVEHQAAEQRLFGLDRMRRQLQRRQLRIAGLRGIECAGLGHGVVMRSSR
jgi:hypothetical protein